MSDELEAIRATFAEMTEVYNDPIWPNGHATIATLLRLLDAAREELSEVREAAAAARTTMALLQLNSEACARLHHGAPDASKTGWLADTRRDLDRLAAALAKDAPR
jgi:hypothetical protein